MDIKGSAVENVGIMQWSTATASNTPLAGTAQDMSQLGKALVVFRLGDMAAETVDCIVEACDAGGANPVTLKAATQLAAHASNNDSKVIAIGVDNNDLAATGKQYIRGKITTGGATGGTCSIVVLGLQGRYLMADLDGAMVAQLVP